MILWFLAREYSKQMIDAQMGKDKFGQRLQSGSKQTDDGVPFVITYHPKLKNYEKARTPFVSD